VFDRDDPLWSVGMLVQALGGIAPERREVTNITPIDPIASEHQDAGRHRVGDG
jgi:hypothetical protein